MSLHPEAAAYLAATAALGLPKTWSLDPVAARLNGASRPPTDLPPADLADIRSVTIPAPAGPMAAELYTPHGAQAGPCIVFYHGGGWVLGSIAAMTAICSHIAARTGWRVLSVDYRLAPEAVFPAAVDDAVAAAIWASGSPAELGGPVTQVITAGDSAGGNLAIAVAGSGQVAIASQLLFYPVTDVSAQAPSYAEFATDHGLEARSMAWFRDHYVSDPEDLTDPRVSPLCDTDFTRYPPTVLLTAGIDVLRDEGRAFGARLVAAGVPTVFREAAGHLHGFITLRAVAPSVIPVIDAAIDDLVRITPDL